MPISPPPRLPLQIGRIVLGGAALAAAAAANADAYRHTVVATPYAVHHSTTVTTPYGLAHTNTRVVDRGQPGWWHGNPAFVGYAGPRPGYYFAPGYGYYAAPHGYGRTTWVVGATLPRPMLHYVVVQPAAYGLRPPPFGYGWYYAGTNFVLVARATGVIAQSVAGGW